MASILNSSKGKVWLLDTNPRQIRSAAFNTLCESLERDEDFLRMRGIIVWQVPNDLEVPDGQKSPFSGQKNKLVVLAGNMRCLALKQLGYTELQDEWIIEAKHADGSWITPEEAERLVLIDNGSIGIAGQNDYEKMLESFNEITMRQSGIDFSEFEGLVQGGEMSRLEGSLEPGKTETEVAETDELHGEKSDELQAFIAEREKTRRDLKEIDEYGFHLLLVFPDGMAQKIAFIEKCGVFKGAVKVNFGPYLDLVFETYDQKMAFAKAMKLEEEDEETGLVPMWCGMFCDGRLFAKKMGIELAGSGLHFRDTIVDHQLAEMAMEPQKQKGEKEIQEEIYAKLKAERKELKMSTRSSGERKNKEEESEDDAN